MAAKAFGGSLVGSARWGRVMRWWMTRRDYRRVRRFADRWKCKAHGATHWLAYWFRWIVGNVAAADSAIQEVGRDYG